LNAIGGEDPTPSLDSGIEADYILDHDFAAEEM